MLAKLEASRRHTAPSSLASRSAAPTGRLVVQVVFLPTALFHALGNRGQRCVVDAWDRIVLVAAIYHDHVAYSPVSARCYSNVTRTTTYSACPYHRSLQCLSTCR
jgi:hypothetical protein